MVYAYMKIIRSKDNSIYKAALKLTKKKHRDETGKYLLEGVKPLENALSMGIEIESVFVSEDADVSMNLPENVTIQLERKLFESLSDTKTSQGVIAVVRKKSYSEKQFAELTSAGGNIAVMDRLQDPGNIGTIIRTAEAAGYKGIVMISGSGDVYAPKVVRAAAGSLFRMPVMFMPDAESAADMFRRLGKKIAVTSLEESVNCFEADLTSDIALVIGNEGRGVSESFMNCADIKVKIPMEGSIESLNAAVAAGILMYQSQKIN